MSTSEVWLQFVELMPVRDAWRDYCLINPSGRPGKFYPDDCFGETIIKLNKEKIRPSSNAKTNHFLREVVAPNVLTLWKTKKVMAKATGATNHGNRHAVVETYHDVMFTVNLLLAGEVFKNKPGRGRGENEESVRTDLFGVGLAALDTGVPLSNYIKRARGNWGANVQEYSEEGQSLFETNTDDLVEYNPAEDND